MEKILRFLEKLVPEPLYHFSQPAYHFAVAFLADVLYASPSKKMFVIGVTGTKGKTTTCNLIAQIFNDAGIKTGMITTANFRIGNKEWKNETKQTMLGRFQLQKTLSKMAKEKCRCAIVETSSEGILQYRHRFVDYNMAVFTNLSPEHLERHGGFENYRGAKLNLFKKVAEKENGFGVYNLDDENSRYVLEPPIKNKWGFAANPRKNSFWTPDVSKIEIKNVKLSSKKTRFTINGEKFETRLVGEFNVYNAAAAVCAALSQKIPTEKIKMSLAEARSPAGRFEIINKGQNFAVIVDYAHEPASLEAAYKTSLKFKPKNSKLICLLGAQGGGRDKWKRPKMGEIAAKYCDKIILTNEDPYDENPLQIISDIERGIRGKNARRAENKRDSSRQKSAAFVYKVADRKEAIKKAISLAAKNDAVILTGKGGESWICAENNKKIPWDERLTVEEILTESAGQPLRKIAEINRNPAKKKTLRRESKKSKLS